MSFAGKQILFIGIGFYDYEHSIVEQLCKRGAKVRRFDERPAFLRDGLMAALLRRCKFNVDGIVQRHEQTILKAAARESYDYVLVIKGLEISLPFLQELRATQPSAEFILYEWDSLARLQGIDERLHHFNRVLTFDRRDATSYPNLEFRPLFYREVKTPAPQNRDSDIDVTFIGWLHSDRLNAVREMQTEARERGMTTFVYIYTGFFTWFRLFLCGRARDVHFRPLSHAAVTAINYRSRCVLDLPHAAQSGLTMRAIEVLAMGKKLITTGRDIIHYDLFALGNVEILEPGKLTITPAFVTKAAWPVSDEIRANYSLNTWLDDVFRIARPRSPDKAQANAP